MVIMMIHSVQNALMIDCMLQDVIALKVNLIPSLVKIGTLPNLIIVIIVWELVKIALNSAKYVPQLINVMNVLLILENFLKANVFAKKDFIQLRAPVNNQSALPVDNVVINVKHATMTRNAHHAIQTEIWRTTANAILV